MVVTNHSIMHNPILLFCLILCACLPGVSQNIPQVKIGNQVWMSENLGVVTFRNGDIIPQAQSREDWSRAGFDEKPAWCYYIETVNGNDSLVTNHGKLYNSYAVNDPRGLAPHGWHIPLESEWILMTDYVQNTKKNYIDLFSIAGWKTGKKGKDSFGFHLYPAGWRDVGCGGLGENTGFWAKKIMPGEQTPLASFSMFKGQEPYFGIHYTTWIMGYYVRCIKD